MILKKHLYDMYIRRGMSMQAIADALHCSPNKVKYWMTKHGIKTRSISAAVYLKKNPDGDPFIFRKPKGIDEAVLYGKGIGLYWGEGTKSNRHSVRLGNTDPALINTFILFLEKFFQVKKSDLRFGLQLFTDINEKKALNFWMTNLHVSKNQFYKIVVTKSGSIGTYRKKSEFGVITVYFNNTKLRNVLVDLCRDN